MRMTILEMGETNLEVIAGRRFPNHDNEKRRKIVEELLRLNPHLADPSEFRPGVIVNLPKIQGLANEQGKEGDEVVSELLGIVRLQLNEFVNIQLQALKESLANQEQQAAILLAEETKNGIASSQSAEVKALADTVAASLATREQQHGEKAIQIKLMAERVSKDLDALAKWLG